MSNIEQIDFSTLIWVKKELDETLKRAQTALEIYAENSEDENQLQFCATYLHQVQGTLKMVELYGAAMVAEEMEQVAKKILDKEVDSEKDAFEVLMRGIILLPDYLERIQLGYKDIPMVLLPLVNDLRTVKGDQLLSESSLFNPDLSLGLPESNLNTTFKLSKNQLNQVVKKIRSAYQVSLLNWLNDHEVESNLKKLQIYVDKLKTIITPIDEKQLFWVAGGLFEALIQGNLEKSVTVKMLCARIDQSIRILNSEDKTIERPYKKLTNNLLYYVALATGKERRTKEIQLFFNLSDYISDSEELESAQSSLSGKNKELLETVSSVIKEDLLEIQDKLDLYNRNENAVVSDLEIISSSLAKISDTIGIIGIGAARTKLKTVIDSLNNCIEKQELIKNDDVMEIAKALLFVESALDENIVSLGVESQSKANVDSMIPPAEMRAILDTLAKESINNLQKFKHSFVLYIESPWNKESIESSPKLLKQISGALGLAGFKTVADEIDKIEVFTSKYMLDPDYKPTVDQLDLLAESIASLEYYLEYISDGTKGEESILNLARSNIEALFNSIENSQNDFDLDKNLDLMTDSDFEEDLEDEDLEGVLDGYLNEDIKTDQDIIINENTAKEEIQGMTVSFSDDTDDDIKEVFLEEFEEELEHLQSIYPRWKKCPEEQVELLGEIRRIYHTLKGSGRLVGAFAIGDFSWKIEELTNMILNNSMEISQEYIQVMDEACDLLPGLYKALENQTVVPHNYNLVIQNAKTVIAGKPLVSKSSELESDLTHKSIKEKDSEILNEDIAEKDITIQDDDLSIDPVFVEILQQEVEGHLNEISNFTRRALETREFKSTDGFIRVVHTLNGAANMASVDSIVEMTSPLELLAKEVNELNLDFDETTVNKIIELKDIAQLIMADLSNKSKSNGESLKLGNYFDEKLLEVETESKLNIVKSLDTNDFDLTGFLDEDSSEETEISLVPIEEEIEESSEEELTLFDEILEDVLLEEETLEDDALEEALEDELVEEETLEDELLEEETLEDALLEDETLEDELIEDETLEDELLEDELLEDETLEDETLEDETLEDETLEDETLEDETLEEETLEDALLDDETLEDELLEEETLEDETLEDETLEDETLEDETLEDETLDEETLEVEPVDHISATIATSYEARNDSELDTGENFDQELLEIFKEEADEILDRTEHVLSDLEENPKDTSLIIALQRDLHTLKGGARMAGLENIGELSHVLESLLENISEDNQKVDKQTQGVIHNSFDVLNKMMNDDFGRNVDITNELEKVTSLVGLKDGIIPRESKLDQDFLTQIDPVQAIDENIEFEDSVVEANQIVKKSNVLSGNQIKVNSELLDNLVNYAGEVSIYRSRLEQEIGSFRSNLTELGNTVSRIREQLRKLDAETETQIISTFQTDEEDDAFDPLEMDRFSQLQQLSRSLTESVSDLTSIHSYLDDVARTSDNLLTQQSRVNTELQEGLMETRLVSFNSIVPRLRRLIRTTANELDKTVKLEVRGAEGEMDKTVLEGVIAPLEHMLRNSLVHGIEKDRVKAKKDEQATVIIDVRREATEVVISVSDDGVGIDRNKVRKIALKKGLIKKGERLNNENIDRLILNSGFSTVETVSKLAGRGVGMDVVSNQVNILGGSLDISSEPKKGTKFSIRLPYTLALSSALLVEMAEVIYAIPVSGLEGIIRMSYPDYLQKIKDKNFIYEYANEDYQLQELNNLLSVDSEVIAENNQIPLVMIRSGNKGVALRVDKILGSREIVVKTVGAQISSVPGIYGATILGDGNVVLILDIIPLSRSYMNKLEDLGADQLEIIEEDVERDPIIMIVDDSITMRKVGERILRRNEYDVVTAKDGLDALENLKEIIPDVMLLDIEMPRMDGYELAIEMKKNEKYANIPIIMITSRTGEKHRQKAMDLGVDRYLGKPYQEADLLSNISGLIEEQEQK